jgi:rhodanese-related sulfurtransferase
VYEEVIMKKMNTELINIFNTMFSQMTKEVLEVAPCRIEASDFIARLKRKENVLTLDIRTEEELSFTKFSYGDVLNIPMNTLFIEENIAKLDKNKEIVVLCHTGARAIAVTILLGLLGFKSIALKGGWVSISEYLSAKTA